MIEEEAEVIIENDFIKENTHKKETKRSFSS